MAQLSPSHAGSASGKMYFKKGKTLCGSEECGKKCDEQPRDIMVEEGGGKEVLQVLETVEGHCGADGYYLKDCIFWRAHMGADTSGV